MPMQTERLEGEDMVLMKFNKDQKFTKRDGCVTVSAKEGEQHYVPEKWVEWLEEIKCAEPVSSVEKIVAEEPAEVIDPTNGKPIKSEEPEETEEVEVDDFTVIHKIGEAIQQELYDKEIYTYAALHAFANTDEGISWLVDQRGITPGNIARIQDNLSSILGG